MIEEQKVKNTIIGVKQTGKAKGVRHFKLQMKDGKQRTFYLDRETMGQVVAAVGGTLAMDDKQRAAFESPVGKLN